MKRAHQREKPEPARRSRLGLGLLLTLGLATLGCGAEGPATYPVRGTVTCQGKPVPHGTVIFNPVATTQPPARGTIGPDGTYELTTYRSRDGAMAGEHKIIVNATTKVDPNLEVGQPGYQAPESLVPTEYSSLSTTPLQRTVAEQENVIDLEL